MRVLSVCPFQQKWTNGKTFRTARYTKPENCTGQHELLHFTETRVIFKKKTESQTVV